MGPLFYSELCDQDTVGNSCPLDVYNFMGGWRLILQESRLLSSFPSLTQFTLMYVIYNVLFICLLVCIKSALRTIHIFILTLPYVASVKCFIYLLKKERNLKMLIYCFGGAEAQHLELGLK